MDQKIYNKLYKKQAFRKKTKKTNLGLQQDYEAKRDEFLELNEKVNDIFLQLKDLKIQFQDLDSQWINAFDEQNEMSNEIIKQLSDLGLDIGDQFDEQNRITTTFYSEGEWDTDGLKYLRS